MPASTKNLRPRIVYLDPETDDELERQARELDRSISYVGRELIREALAWRKGDYQLSPTFLTKGQTLTAHGWSFWSKEEGVWHWWARVDGNIETGTTNTRSEARSQSFNAYQRMKN